MKTLLKACSFAALAALFLGGTPKRAAVLAGAVFALAFLALCRRRADLCALPRAAWAAGAVCAAAGGVRFAGQWHFETPAAALHLPPAVLVGALAVLGALAALPAAAVVCACRAMRRRRALFAALCAAGAAALGVQLYWAFASGYIWQDEVFSLKLIRHSWAQIVRLTAADVHPPLYYFLLKLAALLPLKTAAAGKLLSLLPPLCLWLWAVLTGVRGGGKTRFVCGVFALCVAAMPALPDYSLEIRMYSLGLGFVTAGLLAAWQAAQSGRARHWAALVVFGLCAAYTHYFACVAAAAAYLALLFYVLAAKDRAALRRWCAAAAVTAGGYLPWLFVLLSQLKTVSDSYWIDPITAETLGEYWRFCFGDGPLWAVWAGALGLYAVRLVRRRPRGPAPFFTLAALLTPVWVVLVGVTASALVRPVFVARYLVPALGCLWLGAAAALAQLSRPRLRLLAAAVLALCAVPTMRGFVEGQQYEAAQAAETQAILDAMPEDAVLVSSATRVQEKLAGLCERTSCAWQTSPGVLPNSVYDNLYDLTDAGDVSDWLAAGREVYFFETEQTAGAAASLAEAAGARAVPSGACALGEDITVWRLEADTP